MKAAFLPVCAALALAAACGSKPDGSGVPRDAYMDQLSAEQVTTFCAWGIQKQGGGGEHTCSWGTQRIMTIAECEAKQWPHCQLSLFEDCLGSLADACDRTATAPCAEYADCARANAPDAGAAGADAGP